MTLLVLAGEPSGDRLAASAMRALGSDVRAYGIGSVACARAGVELVADSSELGAMGIGDVAARALPIARAVARLAARVVRDPPRAALLANFTELSARLSPWLMHRGVRVLWCVAPQVWAWRSRRTKSLARAIDRLAVLFPFEVPIWREAGVDVAFVGHPAVELVRVPRPEARRALGLDATARAAVVLPGSRAGEILRLAEPLAAAASSLRARGAIDDARIIAASRLPMRARARLETIAAQHDIALVEADADAGAAPLLRAFDVALAASGTACLEAALAGAPPVVAYKLDPLAYAVARRLVTTQHVALPNIVLGRAAVPELLQGDATPDRIARAAEALLAMPAFGAEIASELSSRLSPPGPGAFGERLAALLYDWLRAPFGR